MAKVFTTSFEHNGQTYTALVTQLDDSLTIRLLDGSLELFLPGGKFSGITKTGTDGVDLSSKTDSLVAAILAEVQAKGAWQENNPQSGVRGESC